MTPHFRDASPSTLQWNKSEKQGSTDASFKWNALSEEIFSPLHAKWCQEERALKIDGEFFTHLIWADNAVLRSRAVKNLPEDEAWDLDAVNAVGKYTWNYTVDGEEKDEESEAPRRGSKGGDHGPKGAPAHAAGGYRAVAPGMDTNAATRTH